MQDHQMREEIKEHNIMRVKEAMESGKALKKATKRKEGYKVPKVLISELKEEDGTIITNREGILEKYSEFYENLYKDAAQNIIHSKAEEVPLILNRKIEYIMKFM